jgi:hypothetical protein
MITREQHLYRRHARKELSAWARRLTYFRFCRAVGGHANDGDQLSLALRYDGEADALALYVKLAGGIVEPGCVQLRGVSVLLLRQKRALTLSLFGADGDAYEVSELDVAHAEALEPHIVPLAARLIDPPIDSEHCISPQRYPEFFSR